MALIFDRQYYLDFDTTTGQDIKWTLEIWRSYEEGTSPSWVGNETKLVGTGNPIEIEWSKDFNIYKPIIGSRANINLQIQEAEQYDRFNEARPYEYQVRLNYKEPTIGRSAVITMEDDFDAEPTQYTSTFTSPNSQLVPAITLPTGSQGTQFSLTESDGTVHRFGYITNGNYRYLDAGLTGTVRKGTAQAATTATTTGSFTITDQGADQTLTLAGDETGTFAVGDFISQSSLVAQAFRGVFIETVVFDGTNTVLTGTAGGGTTFDTTDTIYRSGPADEIQGSPTFTFSPDSSGVTYPLASPVAFTTEGVNTDAHLSFIGNTTASNFNGTSWNGATSSNGDGTTSITIDLGTSEEIDSSFSISGGLNNTVSVENIETPTGQTVDKNYWMGYMTALDGKEKVSTFPFSATYTATDGLGLLEQATAEPQVSIDPVKPWDGITAALIQTGLHLPIYLDTGIEVGDDSTPQLFTEALDTVTLNPEWVYEGRDRIKLLTHKEKLEKVLSTFNATIKQSQGKWYITNASTYGGTGDSESTTFSVYTAEDNTYTKSAPATEDLRYNINGTDTQELIPSNDDLVLTTRRPYGSIECSPEGLFSRDIENGGFEIVNEDATESPVGFSPGPTEGPLRTSTNIRQDGLRSLYTPHNTFEIDTINDVWFRNTNGLLIDSTAPIELSFDYLTYERVEDTLLSVGFAYQVSFVPDNEYKVSIPYYDLNVRNYVIGEVTVQELFYNADDSEWYAVSTQTPAANFGFFTQKIEFPVNSGKWLEEAQTLERPAIYDSVKKEIVPPGPGQLYIRAFFPRAADLNGNIENNSDAVLDFFVDNLSIRNMFANDVTNPTFEAVQEDYNSTFNYKPGLASSTNDRLVQTLFEKDYRRTNTSAQTIETLEQIGTQLKLNDYRNHLKYYQGNLVNLTTTPLAPHNKVLIDWDSVNYVETASCIINGGRFNVKGNQFEVAMYVPDQATDVANEYYLENVDLIPMPFPGLSNKRAYTLNVTATTVDTDGVTVPDGLVPVMPSYTWTGSPGDKRQIEIALQPIEEMGASSATTIDPAPEHLSDIMYTVNSSNLRVNALLTIPEESTLETLNISGVIRDFTPEINAAVVAHTINFYRPVDSNVLNPTGDAVTETSPVTGLPTNYIRTSVAAAGIYLSQQQITYTIEAIEGRVMTNVQETHDLGALGFGRVSGNEERMATITFPFTVPGTASTIDVFLDDTTTNDNSGNILLINKTLTITNNLADFSIEDGVTSGNETTLNFRGPAGDFRRQNITVNPSSDRYIRSITTTPGITPAPFNPVNGLIIGTPYSSGEDWEIPIEVSLDDNNIQPSFAISGEAPLEPYSISFNANNLGLSNARVLMPEYQVEQGTVASGDITIFLNTNSFTASYGTGVNVEVGDKFIFSTDFEVQSNSGLAERTHNVTSVNNITNVATLDNPSEARDATGVDINSSSVTGSIRVDRPFSKISFDEGDFGDTFPRPGESYLVTVVPTGNHVFTATTAPYDILVDINEAAATVTVDGTTMTRQLPEIQFSPGTITLQNDGSYVFPIGGTFPTAEQGGGQYVLDINIISSATSNNGDGSGPTPSRASQNGTSIVPLTPGLGTSSTHPNGTVGISAGGGSGQYKLIADGEWRIQNIEVTLGGAGTITSTDGSFEETFTSTLNPQLSFTQRGSIGPVTGGAGEHTITLTAEAIGYDSGFDGDTPIIYRPADWQIDYIFNVIGNGPQGSDESAPALKGASATQNGTFGPATIVYPGFSDATLMGASTDTGAENLIFFG